MHSWGHLTDRTDTAKGRNDSQMAIAVRVLLAMYRRGLCGSCLGSVNTQGTGMDAASAKPANSAKQASAAEIQKLATEDKARLDRMNIPGV